MLLELGIGIIFKKRYKSPCCKSHVYRRFRHKKLVILKARAILFLFFLRSILFKLDNTSSKPQSLVIGLLSSLSRSFLILIPILIQIVYAFQFGHRSSEEILAGANVVMPNLSPSDVRGKYLLYDNKICTGDEAAECIRCMAMRISSVVSTPSARV